MTAVALDELVSDVRLADGTAVHALLDFGEHGVSARTLVDAEIYQFELEKIWNRNWIFVAHESEVPSPGDFVLRRIGDDPVIVTHDRDSSLHVILNVCSHRGGQVCRVDKGNTSYFRCPYHGWTYNNAGELSGVPLQRQVYKDALARSSLRLPGARVDSYCGLIFATWDEELPPLVDYLGDFRFYSDMFFGVTDGGWEVAGPPQRWIIRTNWKIPAENFTGDVYHAQSVHQVLVDIGLMPPTVWKDAMEGVNVSAPEWGHGGRCSMLSLPEGTHPSAAMNMVYGAIPAELHDQIERHLSVDQLRLVAHGSTCNVGTIFPNFTFLGGGGGGVVPGVSMRTWNPYGPNATEVLSWSLVPRDASQEWKIESRRALLRDFGSSGIFEQDDSEAWSQIQRNVGGLKGRARTLLYNASSEPNPEAWLGSERWPGPGEVRIGVSTDDNQWNWWCRWLTCIES